MNSHTVYPYSSRMSGRCKRYKFNWDLILRSFIGRRMDRSVLQMVPASSFVIAWSEQEFKWLRITLNELGRTIFRMKTVWLQIWAWLNAFGQHSAITWQISNWTIPSLPRNSILSVQFASHLIFWISKGSQDYTPGPVVLSSSSAPWYQLGLVLSEIGRLCADLLKRVFPWLKSFDSYRVGVSIYQN